MQNLNEGVRSNPAYTKRKICDFLFAEYICGVGAERLGVAGVVEVKP